MLVKIANNPKLLALILFVHLVIAATLFSFVEHKSADDAIWWSVVTASTVGYGDISPAHIPGRIIAALVMGPMVVFYVPMLTAGLASKLIVNRDAFTHEEQEDLKHMMRKTISVIDSNNDGKLG